MNSRDNFSLYNKTLKNYDDYHCVIMPNHCPHEFHRVNGSDCEEIGGILIKLKNKIGTK